MKFSTFLYLGLTLIFCTACSDEFLDRQPLDQIVSTNFYQTQEDAQQALVAIYDAFGYQSTPGIGWSPFMIMSDILSDDSFAGGSDANDGFDEDQLNNFKIATQSNIVRSIWNRNYTGIYRANILLERIGEMEAPEEFKQRVIAEANFFRAYFYFELVRFYENIPLLTETIKGPSEYSQSQNTPSEVYNQIATDLVASFNGLPEQISANETGRISLWAAKALLGRVFLFYNGVYGQDLTAGSTAVNQSYVVAQLDDLIENSGHDLLEDYNMIFRKSSEFSVESVLEIQYADSPVWWDWGYVRGGEGNLSAQMQGPRVTESANWNRGWSFAPVSQTLVDALNGDPRQDATITFEEEIDGNVVRGYQHTGYFSGKYSSDAEHWGSGGQFELNRTCNYRVIRFADVLLMAAELGSPNAQDHMDRVRTRVGLGSIPVNAENILEERHRELALEGIRYFDVLRANKGNELLTRTGIRGANYEGDQQIYDVQFNAATRGFLPIPQSEIDLSAGTLIQNAGY